MRVGHRDEEYSIENGGWYTSGFRTVPRIMEYRIEGSTTPPQYQKVEREKEGKTKKA